ncbi:MAG: hypothetical protein WDM76_17025 [Limisphaerales bacterium]
MQLANHGAYKAQLTGDGGVTNTVLALLNIFTGTLNNGLVAYLPFDNDYKDYSGRSHNGTPVGSPAFATGRVGGALHFSVTNDLSVNNYVTLGYPADLQFGTNDFSVGFCSMSARPTTGMIRPWSPTRVGAAAAIPVGAYFPKAAATPA